MQFALSTNWCSQRLESGEAIADKALELGFDALELGFRTSPGQAEGFRRALGRIKVGSVHAFCPVPVSAPEGYPELYQLASLDEDARRIARVHVVRNVEFAASMGADAVVLHAGRVDCGGWLKGRETKRRVRRGRRLTDVFRRELEAIMPALEKNGVTLGLENLPYLEGYPAEWELSQVCGEWVRPWFDTGHDHVRALQGWKDLAPGADAVPPPVGMHINDSKGGDDHLAPGEGDVDFAALAALARSTRHLVLEPAHSVSEDSLRAGLAHLKQIWQT